MRSHTTMRGRILRPRTIAASATSLSPLWLCILSLSLAYGILTVQELYNQTKTRVDRKRQHEAQSIDRSQHPVSVSAATSGHAGNYTAFSSEPILEARAGATTGTQYSNDSATPSLEYNKLPAHRTMAQNVQSGRIGSL